MSVSDPAPLDRLRLELLDAIHGLGGRMATMETRLAAVETGLTSVETGLVDVRAHVDATAVQTRRHFDVVAEALRSEIRLVAEGVIALDEKTERFRAEVGTRFAAVDRRFLHLEARVVTALEGR